MTKVNLTVTKDLTEVPDAICSQLSEIEKKMENLLRTVEKMKTSVSAGWGLPIGSLKSPLEEVLSSLESTAMQVQDVYNICGSYASIQSEQEQQQKKEDLEKEVSAYKFEVEAKVGQLMANEKLLSQQIQQLTGKLKEMQSLEQTKTPKKKTTKKSKT